MPVTVVPTSFATVAIETFMTELSRVIRNWPDARVSRTSPVFWVRPTSVTGGWYPSGAPGGLDPRRPVVRRRRHRLPPGRDPIHLDVDRETQRDPHHDDQAQRQGAGQRRTDDDGADDVGHDEDLQTQQDRAAETCADLFEHAGGGSAARQLDDAANQRQDTADDQDQNADGFEGLDGVVHGALEQHDRTIPCDELRRGSWSLTADTINGLSCADGT